MRCVLKYESLVMYEKRTVIDSVNNLILPLQNIRFNQISHWYLPFSFCCHDTTKRHFDNSTAVQRTFIQNNFQRNLFFTVTPLGSHILFQASFTGILDLTILGAAFFIFLTNTLTNRMGV